MTTSLEQETIWRMIQLQKKTRTTDLRKEVDMLVKSQDFDFGFLKCGIKIEMHNGSIQLFKGWLIQIFLCHVF